MSWIAVGVMAAGALAGHMKNKKAQEIENADRKLAAANQKFSWASGQGGGPAQIQRAGSMWGDVLGGATSGLATGISAKGAFAGGTETPAGGDANWWEKYQNEQPGQGQASQAAPWWGGK